jgi:uncharacterized membrane protein
MDVCCAPMINIDRVAADMLLCEVTGKLCFFCVISMAVVITVLFLENRRLAPCGTFLCVVQIALLDNRLSIYSGYTYT